MTVKLTDDDLAALEKVSALPLEFPQWQMDRQSADRRGVVGG